MSLAKILIVGGLVIAGVAFSMLGLTAYAIGQEKLGRQFAFLAVVAFAGTIATSITMPQ